MLFQKLKIRNLHLSVRCALHSKNLLKCALKTPANHRVSLEDRMKWKKLNKTPKLTPLEYMNQIKNQKDAEKTRRLISVNLKYFAHSKLHLPTVFLTSFYGKKQKESFYFNFPETSMINCTQVI